jgi:hypothetical protein
MPATQEAVMPMPNWSQDYRGNRQASSLATAKIVLRDSCRPPRRRPMVAWSRYQCCPGQRASGGEQGGRAQRSAYVPEVPVKVRGGDSEHQPQHKGPGAGCQQSGRYQAGTVRPPRELADEDSAEAQHADRAKQGHGRHRGRTVTDRLLAEQARGERPVEESQHGRHARGRDETGCAAQQVLMPSPRSHDGCS